MAKDVDLSSKEWRDLVFEGKNKEFGAYELRQGSVKRHNWAMIAVVIFIIACFLVTLVVNTIAKAEEDVANTGIEQATFEEFTEEQPEEEIDEPEYIEPEIPEVPKEEILNTQAVTELDIVPPDKVTTPPVGIEEQQADDRAVGSVDQTGGVDNIIDATTHNERVQVEIPKPEPPKVDDHKVFDHVEQMPMFPGGEAALLKWVAEHIKYPTICQENGIQGRVTVQFVVTKDGSVGQVRVVRSKDPDLDKEAVRVVKSLPKFTPGKQNGIPVNVWYTLPITFRLQQ